MPKRIMAGTLVLAAAIAISACGRDDRTAAVDEDAWVAPPPDTAMIGVPGGTLGVPADTLITDTLRIDTEIQP